MILGGKLDFPDIALSPHRAIPVAVVRGNSTGNPLFHSFNLSLETGHEADASRGEIGRVLVRAGDALPNGTTPPDGGAVYIQSGDGHDGGSGDGGNIFLAPGYGVSGATSARVQLANPDHAVATVASLTAAGAFVGGVNGAIDFAVPGIGIVTANILLGDTLAQVQTKLAALPGLACVVNPGNDPIAITTLARGPNADVYFIQDDQSGALNTALGDFSIGGGAVFTAGTWPEQVGIGATGTNELTVFGDLVVTGTLTSSVPLHASDHISGGADEIDGDRLDITWVPVYYTRDTTPAEVTLVEELTSHLAGVDTQLVTFKRNTINSAASPYTVLDTDHYLGVDTTGGIVVIEVPTSVSGNWSGRILIINDEGGNALTNAITVQVSGGGQIDGAASVPINTNYASVTIVSSGTNGASTQWYTV
jgi:hypothetical protein